ncbi:MAG: hypothetical protein GXP33_09760 [Spirochaetes bacterium]|nr:hypothetical protein [Spirochaetota bacterium]
MLQREYNSIWIETALFSISSIFLYQLSLGIFLFLIPLQILYIRHGEKYFIASLLTTFSVVALVKYIRLKTSSSVMGFGVFFPLELAILTSFLAGIFLINYIKLQKLSTLYRLFVITAGFGIASVPVILALQGNESFRTEMNKLFTMLSTYMQNIFLSKASTETSVLKQILSPEALKKTTSLVFFRSYLFDYFTLIAFSWWAGNKIGNKYKPVHIIEDKHKLQLSQFKLEDFYIWPLIISLAVILIDLWVKTGALAAIAWNIALILLLLYGLAGISLLRFLFNYFNLSRGFRIMITATIILLLLSPKINIVFLLMIPGLGISEIWIKYREMERRNKEP